MNKNPAAINVVMISTDNSLAGGKALGDAVRRHRQYGAQINHLDIIVYAAKAEQLTEFEISEKVIGYPSNSQNKLFFWFDAIKIFRQINQKNRTDIVVSQDPFLLGLIGWYFKKRYKIKLQINFHGDFWQNKYWLKERPLNWFFLQIAKFIVPRADAIRVMSQGQKEKFMNSGISADKIRVISTPVEIGRFASSTASRPRELPIEKKIILMVGRQDKVKDFETLFKAITEVYRRDNNICLCLIGNYDSVDRDKLPLPKDLATIIHRHVDTELLPAYYQASDIVVLSSTSESFGKVLVEANACGKPVISTATTGAKEIIKDGYNGYLVPIKDYHALAEKILLLINNPDQARQLGVHGAKLVQENFGNNTQKIVSLWQDLVENKLS